MLAGAAAVLAAGLMSSRYSQSGFGSGIALAVAGAILAWVVDLDLPYVADYTPGAILAVAVLAAVAAALLVRHRTGRTRVATGPYGPPYRY